MPLGRGNVAELILKITKKGDGAREAQREIGGLEKAVKTAGKVLVAFGGTQAVRASYDLAKLGAQAMRTETAFRNISGGADEAAARLEAMQTATRGAITDTEAMASANQLMQMGLANSAGELENVATMAVRLGTAMGRDANQSLEEFSLLLANQSIPRLDTFGISAGKVRTRINELRDANEDMTRESAFMQAVMEEGRRSMDRLGDSTEDAALQFERAEAQMRQARIELGKKLAPVWAGFLTKLNTGLEILPKWHTMTKQFTGSLYAWGLNAIGAHDAAKRLADRLVALGEDTEDAGDQAIDTAEAMSLLHEEMSGGRRSVDGATTSWADFRREVEDSSMAISDQVTVLDDHGMALGRLEAGISGDVSKANKELAEELEELQFEHREYEGVLQRAIEKHGLYSDEANKARGELGELERQIGVLQKEHREKMNMIIFDMLQARAAADGFSKGEIQMLRDVGVELGVFDEESATVWDNVMGYYDEAIDASGEFSGSVGAMSAEVIAAMGGVQDSFEDFLYIFNQLPDEHHIKVTYDLAQPNLPGPGDNIPRQHGGPVMAGMPYIVGESGPELFVPGRSGGIVPNQTTRNITNNFHQTVHTSAGASEVLHGFDVMRTLVN